MIKGIGHAAFNVKDMEKTIYSRPMHLRTMPPSRAQILIGSVGLTIPMASRLS